MAGRSTANSWRATVVLDGLLNYGLFAPLNLIFWYGTATLFEVLVLDGPTNRLPRAALGLIASSAFEVWAALDQRRLGRLGESILTDSGYPAYFVLTRLYNYLMGVADVFLFSSVEVFYEEYVGPAETKVHARWAVALLVMAWSLRISRNLVSTPFVVSLDDSLEDEWFDYNLYFKTRPSSPFVVRLFDAIFSVAVVSSILDTYWFTLTFVFDGVVSPLSFVEAMALSCVVGYVIVGLVKCLTPFASAASADMERKGRQMEKLVVEDGFLFAANFGVILLWKGLSMFAQQLSETLGPVFGVSADTMAIADQLLAFSAMSTLGVSSMLVFKGPVKDGELTSGQGLYFSTHYFVLQPQTGDPYAS